MTNAAEASFAEFELGGTVFLIDPGKPQDSGTVGEPGSVSFKFLGTGIHAIERPGTGRDGESRMNLAGNRLPGRQG